MRLVVRELVVQREFLVFMDVLTLERSMLILNQHELVGVLSYRIHDTKVLVAIYGGAEGIAQSRRMRHIDSFLFGLDGIQFRYAGFARIRTGGSLVEAAGSLGFLSVKDSCVWLLLNLKEASFLDGLSPVNVSYVRQARTPYYSHLSILKCCWAWSSYARNFD